MGFFWSPHTQMEFHVNRGTWLLLYMGSDFHRPHRHSVIVSVHAPNGMERNSARLIKSYTYLMTLLPYLVVKEATSHSTIKRQENTFCLSTGKVSIPCSNWWWLPQVWLIDSHHDNKLSYQVHRQLLNLKIQGYELGSPHSRIPPNVLHQEEAKSGQVTMRSH